MFWTTDHSDGAVALIMVRMYGLESTEAEGVAPLTHSFDLHCLEIWVPKEGVLPPGRTTVVPLRQKLKQSGHFTSKSVGKEVYSPGWCMWSWEQRDIRVVPTQWVMKKDVKPRAFSRASFLALPCPMTNFTGKLQPQRWERFQPFRLWSLGSP